MLHHLTDEEWSQLERMQGRSDVITTLRANHNEPVEVRNMHAADGNYPQGFTIVSINRRISGASLRFVVADMDTRNRALLWPNRRLQIHRR
ncbi:MAG: hypothetical protein AB202_03150 [Parcubacteria bacterium C7867-007]|nr:MAG: hypothetical protein AB202_03150 [Parcubacteria bacterium C7867-007]